MSIRLIPTPQRCTLLSSGTQISESTPVILQTPDNDERLVAAAKKLFSNVELRTGSYALYSANFFASRYEFGRKEGYLLWIRSDTLSLASDDARGLFYGMQTIRQWMRIPERPAVEICDWPELSMRSDYLDMRGIFPKFENVLHFIEEMAEYKFNTLVVEYEDKLPRPRTEFVAPHGALTPEQHRRMMKAAHDNFIDIIPLQQCFGHLEYALKLPEYQHLREDPAAPGELCPLREGSFELACSLIDETVAMHPECQYLHLGCDEVWSLGHSEECKKTGKSRSELAVEYINRLAEKTLSLGKTPIVWHDMFASTRKNGTMVASDDLSVLSKLNKNVIVALWLYSPTRVNSIAPDVIETLNSLGIRTLPCSATRAADGSVYQNYPCVEQRLRNIDSWCEVIRHSRCTGMVNTNWCSTFSLGNPYGLFETSRYTAYYAAERCWNMDADTSDFLGRFLSVYHGVENPKVITGAESRYDYYTSMSTFLSEVTRNVEIARLVSIMYHLEHAVPVNATVFRGDYFAGSEVELCSLRDRAEKNYASLAKIEQEFKAILPEFLTSEDAALFYESRCYENRLHRRELERILGITLG